MEEYVPNLWYLRTAALGQAETKRVYGDSVYGNTPNRVMGLSDLPQSIPKDRRGSAPAGKAGGGPSRFASQELTRNLPASSDGRNSHPEDKDHRAHRVKYRY